MRSSSGAQGAVETPAGEEDPADATPEARTTVVPIRDNLPSRPSPHTSEYHEIETGCGTLHVTIVYGDAGPFRVFVNLSPIGSEISGLASVVGILLSKYLEAGGDPTRILKHLNSVRSDRPHGFGPERIDSVPHAVAECLKAHLVRTGRMGKNEERP